MKSVLLLACLVFFVQNTKAQNLNIQENVIIYNNKSIGLLEQKGCENMQEFCLYIVHDLAKENFLIAANVFNFHQPATPNNPDGNKIFYYLNLSFNGFEGTAEIDFPEENIHTALSAILEKGLIKDGALDKEKVKAFIKEQGTKYSNQNPNVLILQEQN